jgi:hypothetical protein
MRADGHTRSACECLSGQLATGNLVAMLSLHQPTVCIYCEVEVEATGYDAAALQWSNALAAQYPTLSAAALRLMSVPVRCASERRLDSVGGPVYTKFRLALGLQGI